MIFQLLAKHLKYLRAPPVIFQVTNLDCGLASLAMVFRHYGRHESLETIRTAIPGSASDTSVRSLIRGAMHFGFAARAVRVRLSQIDQLKLPAVIHWNFNHFVVLERVYRGQFTVADPSTGRKIVAREEFSDHFTGIAVEVWPTAKITPLNNIIRLSITDLWTSVQGFKTSAILVFFVSIGVQFLLLLIPLMLSVMVDRVSTYKSLNLLLATAIATGVAAVIGSLGEVVRRWLLLSVGNQLNAQISLNFISHLIRLPYRFFQERRINDLMSRVESIKSIKETLVNESVPAIIDGAFSVLTLCVVFMLSPLLAIVMVVSASIYAIIRILAFNPQRMRLDRTLETAGVERGAVMETVRGIQTVKVLSAEWARLSIWHGANRDSNTALQKQNELQSLIISLKGLITTSDLIVVIFVAMSLVLKDYMTLGILFAVIALRQQFQDRMFGLVDRSFEFGMIRLHLSRISDVTRAPKEFQPADVEMNVVGGAINVEDLGYKYSSDKPWVFRHLTFSISPGEFVAICGPSGEGKTTLARLLLGLLSPEEGAIYVDNQRLSPQSFVGYRAATAAVLQDDQLFSGTILENICAFDPDIELDQVVESAKLAFIHDDILAMSAGYYSRIGDMGSALSGGQKQRILLARALYHRPKILFLDEGTANLDMAKELSVVQSLRNLNITVICIAHRSATLDAADRVLSLSNGTLTEVRRSSANALKFA